MGKMNEIKVEFSDIVTPEVCSLIITELIKYIVYDSQQIPYPYKAWTHLVTTVASREGKGSDGEKLKHSRAHSQAKRFYEQISNLYYNLENTFMSISQELCESSGVEEVLFLLGSSIVTPKHAFRIRIPRIEFGHVDVHHPPERLLPSLLKGILSHDTFGLEIEPMNMFVLLKMSSGRSPRSGWFLPRDNFRLHPRAKEVVFRLEAAAADGATRCPCSKATTEARFQVYQDQAEVCEKKGLERDPEEEGKVRGEDENGLEDKEEDLCTDWYSTHVSLQGFKHFKLDGTSIYNYLLERFHD